jgi:hypothetical protein
MKRVAIIIATLLACQTGVAWAQKIDSAASKGTATAKPEQWTTSPGELKPTAEMWFYEQALRQYQDPKLAVRQAAEFRGQQRQQRLAAMQWYGLSNARPRASSDPFHSDYAPGWTSNNLYYPNRWTAEPVIVVRPDVGGYYR